jgi:hypothetical protein
LYVQELVAEVDEKGRRIDELETELNVKVARIRDLEMASESIPQTHAVREAELTSPFVERLFLPSS